MDVMTRRQDLGLTQAEAAERARVSVATWRRFEADPGSVVHEIRSACERVLEQDPIVHALAEEAAELSRAWQKSEDLTPRQAFALTMVLDRWADELAGRDHTAQRLGDVGPFEYFDDRVMFRIGESRAYAAATARRCSAIATMIRGGSLPFRHDGPMIDETLITAAAKEAEGLYPDWLAEMTEVFDLIGIRTPVEDDELDAYMPGDEDWDEVEDRFDELSRWPSYDYPLGYGDDADRSQYFDSHHPFTWFDSPPQRSDVPLGPRDE